MMERAMKRRMLGFRIIGKRAPMRWRCAFLAVDIICSQKPDIGVQMNDSDSMTHGPRIKSGVVPLL